jgi:hypothetical protein
MAVYTKLKELEEIRNEKILLIGCPFCANLSLAYEKGKPAYKLTIRGIIAVAMEEELHALERKLRKENSVKRWRQRVVSSPLCAMSGRKQKALKNISERYTMILTLCCMAGHFSIKRETGKKVIPAMETAGVLSTSLRIKWNRIFVDRGKTKVIRMGISG